MLRDRFKEWGILKYHRRERHEVVEPSIDDAANGQLAAATVHEGEVGTAPLFADGGSRCPVGLDRGPVGVWEAMTGTDPSRALDIPFEEQHLHKTLTGIHHFLDNLVDECTWSIAVAQPALELQKLAADAHMAIASHSYNPEVMWAELGSLYSPLSAIMPMFHATFLHPRVFTVLLRLLVNGISRPMYESTTLEAVRFMFYLVSCQTLQPLHPIRLLCGMPSDEQQTTKLLWQQLALVDSRLYARIDQVDPIFVAQEKTYSARVLASLGYFGQADALLDAVQAQFDLHGDLFTMADCYRTLGYTRYQSGSLEEAKPFLKAALWGFVTSGNHYCENIMYTHMCLGWVTQRLDELEASQKHQLDALAVWESNKGQRVYQGAVKLIRDLDKAYRDQGKFNDSVWLRQKYPEYF